MTRRTTDTPIPTPTGTGTGKGTGKGTGTGTGTGKGIEGEGSRRAAHAYNRQARTFARSGKVDEAARVAVEKVAEEPLAHAVAELVTRRPARGEDPELNRSAWWTAETQGAWDRIKSSLRRDWDQTLYDVTGGNAGAELDQGVADTLRQMAGEEQIPPSGEPSGISAGVDWSGADMPLRFGFGAAERLSAYEWVPEVEEALAADWKSLPGAAPWEQVRASVYVGWQLRRREPL